MGEQSLTIEIEEWVGVGDRNEQYQRIVPNELVTGVNDFLGNDNKLFILFGVGLLARSFFNHECLNRGRNFSG